LAGDAEVMVIDGVEVTFSPREDGTVVVSAAPEGRVLGKLRLSEDATFFRAETADGRVVDQPSPWGGRVSARFRTRELGARALLLAEGGTPSRE
jgi:hypothetical protein